MSSPKDDVRQSAERPGDEPQAARAVTDTYDETNGAPIVGSIALLAGLR
jgi:hypothetical protein